MSNEVLMERGIVVSCETIRRWAKKFGPDYARHLQREQPSRGDVWHLDEVAITIAGKKHGLWQAVDQDGYVLDEIVQSAQYQGGQAIADQARHHTKADDHRQVMFLRDRSAAAHAECRTPFAQGI
ncbi:IS6 family transposase (plasmid) [Xanthobacter dioxanivorans]|uniref:IS6 family transposase n=1 Tax=Xanthobacter dioxanivorans TaxID=2528964 RepID=A0A974PVK6_9HYPH|nr:IS6 family transposase [Xanthobacter dioxanivorans]